MKKLLLLMLISINTFGQNVDSVKNLSSDSVDIRKMLQQQISNAMKKPSTSNKDLITNQFNEVKENPSKILLKDNNTKTNVSLASSLFDKVPFQHKIFIISSLLIVLSVLIRRIIIQHKRKNLREYKNKIALLREEKLFGSIDNKKKKQIRISLRENPITLRQNEKEISLNAKQLNISKGELLLAARLKLLELNKVQRSIWLKVFTLPEEV